MVHKSIFKVKVIHFQMNGNWWLSLKYYTTCLKCNTITLIKNYDNCKLFIYFYLFIYLFICDQFDTPRYIREYGQWMSMWVYMSWMQPMLQTMADVSLGMIFITIPMTSVLKGPKAYHEIRWCMSNIWCQVKLINAYHQILKSL